VAFADGALNVVVVADEVVVVVDFDLVEPPFDRVVVLRGVSRRWRNIDLVPFVEMRVEV
jgi:hypothetical protein